jgi:diguanylate cyclase (GGDEF)-like protein
MDDSQMGYLEFKVMDETSGETDVTDGLTGLPNRRGFEVIIDNEERRCRRYDGTPAVFVIELADGDGEVADDVLRTAAATLATAIRDTDVLARVGGDVFALLATNCDEEGIKFLAGRLKLWLEIAGIPASVRARRRVTDLQLAWREALIPPASESS